MNSATRFARFSSLDLLLVIALLKCSFPALLSAQTTISGVNWFPIGPADVSNGQTYGGGRVNVSGRATVIAVNQKNPNDIWLGTASAATRPTAWVC
jgi:hypothetical protein